MKTKLAQYSNSLVQLSAGPTVLFLPFLNGTVTRAVTRGLMIQHHAIICVHLRSPCYPPLSPFDLSLSRLCFSSSFLIPVTLPSSFHFPPYASFSFISSSVCFTCFHFSYLFFISSPSLLLLPMLWVKHASQSLVGRTVSTVHGNLSVMKTCNS